MEINHNNLDDKTLSFWLDVVFLKRFVVAAATVGVASFVSIHLRKKDFPLNENERRKKTATISFVFDYK